MSPEQLQAIRERAEKATQGPWQRGTGYQGDVYSRSGIVIVDTEDSGSPRQIRDATFIAHARQDIPDLLAYVAELEAEALGAGMAISQLAAERDEWKKDALSHPAPANG